MPFATQTLDVSTGTAWQHIVATYTPATDGSHTFSIRDINPAGGGNDFAIDDIRVAEIITGPEPYVTTYTENGAGVPIADITGSVTDPENTTITSAVITLTDAQTADFLSSGNMPAGISASAYDPVTHTITLSGTATLASYQIALQAITFANSSDALSNVDRHVSVTVNDGALDSNTSFATVHVIPVNDPPVAQHDSLVTDQNTAITGNVLAANGLGADSDVEGDTLAVTEINGQTYTPGQQFTLPSGALLTVAGDGTFAYDPNHAFDALGHTQNTFDTFSYQISDGHGGFSTATATVEVKGLGDPMSITGLTDGTVAGTDASVTESSLTGGSSTAGDGHQTVAGVFTVSAGDLPNFLYANGQTVFGGPIAGSYGTLTIMGVSPTAGVTNGTTYDIAYSYTLTGPVDHTAGAVADTFSLIFGDNDGDTVTANLNIAIADDKPMALDDAADATEDQTTAVTGSVITNDPFGADGASASPVIGVIAGDNCAEDTGANVGQPVQGLYGTLTLNADGTYSYQLDNNNPSVQALSAGATMNEVFTYQIADNEAGSGTTATTTVSVSFASFPAASNMSASACNDPNMPEAKLVITITGVNDAPVANTDAGTAPEDGPAATGNVLTTPGLGIDTDVDGDTLQVTGGVQGSHVLVLETPFTTAGGGVLTLHGDGSYTFDPGTAYNALPVGSTATETIAYTISDGHGGTATANLVITITGANDAPELLVSLGDKSGFDGGAVFITTAGAFSDPDHDTLYFSAAGLPASLTIDPLTGKITGTLDASDSIGGPNNDGIYIVTVTADDHHGGTVSDSFRFTATNLKPVAVNDVATVSEDGPAASGNVLSDITTGDHDTAPDSDPLMVTGGTQGATVIALDTPTTLSGGGELTLHADGSYSFTPGTAYNGLAQGATATETVTYDITDGNGGVAQATLVITVQGQNDAPVAINPANPGTPANPIPATDPLHVIPDVASTDGATPAAVDVGAILRDPDGETLVFTATGLPIGLAIDPNTGIITGTLPADASQHGPYTVHVIATDPHGVAATTDVIYRAINLPPVAENDTATTAENTVATGKALSNDHDAAPDADMLHIAEINGNPASVGRPVIGSTGGTFVVKPDGTWTFDPGHAFDNLAVGQSRDTQVTYLVADGEGGTDTATITVTVTGVNDPPVALGPIAPVSGADSVSVTPIDTSVAFSNPNHLPLTYTATNLPAGLVIDPATGVIAGTPAHDASVQGPYVVTVTATAPTGATSSTLLQINVANPGPTSVADNAATPAGTPVVIVPLANDSDPDHDVLSITSIASPAHGTATLTSDGTIIYVPNAGFTGTETISYTISDAQGGTSTASITIVVGAPPAGAPVLVGAPASQNGTDGSPITPIDIGALVTDPNGQILAFSATGLPAGLTIDPATGIISGTPASDASLFGPYSVVVTAVDPDGNQVSTTLLLAIADPAPVAANDATSTPANTPVVISLLANDTDPDHDSLNVSYVSAPAHGTVIINPDGTVTYTPNAGYIGPDAFTYTASDGQGGTSAATVAVAVGSSNPNAPTVDAATPHTATGTDGAPIAPINVGSHITDPNHDPLAFTASGLPAGLVINPATGVITGTLPNDASAQGPYTVTVTAVDPAGNQVMTTLVIAATNPAPMASNDTATTIAGQPVVIGVLANDTDPDHDALTVTSAMPPSHGTVTINPNGTITYKPLAVYTGTDTFQYKITDANGATASATVTLNVGVPGPLAATPAIAPVTGSDGQPIAPVPVAAAFGDPDQVGTLTLSVDPTELPPGISSLVVPSPARRPTTPARAIPPASLLAPTSLRSRPPTRPAPPRQPSSPSTSSTCRRWPPTIRPAFPKTGRNLAAMCSPTTTTPRRIAIRSR